MRRTLLQTSMLALIALVAIAGVVARASSAQEATPGPIVVNQRAPGVAAEVFAGVPTARAGPNALHGAPGFPAGRVNLSA